MASGKTGLSYNAALQALRSLSKGKVNSDQAAKMIAFALTNAKAIVVGEEPPGGSFRKVTNVYVNDNGQVYCEIRGQRQDR